MWLGSLFWPHELSDREVGHEQLPSRTDRGIAGRRDWSIRRGRLSSAARSVPVAPRRGIAGENRVPAVDEPDELVAVGESTATD